MLELIKKTIYYDYDKSYLNVQMLYTGTDNRMMNERNEPCSLI